MAALAKDERANEEDMSMKAIQVGSIGLGNISRGVHLPGIEKSPDLSLYAICDLDPQRLQEVGERYAVPESRRFTDYRQLIACPGVEAVDISTPNDCHFPIAMEAVRAGKPYCLEKPVTMNADQARELAQATEAKGLKSMVCFSYRFKPAARFARELVQRGELGRLYHVDMQYFQAWGLPAAACKYVWRYEKRRTGSGALGDLGSHALDLCAFVTGKCVQSLVGHTGTYVKERPLLDGSGMGQVDVDDFSNYMAQLEDGISASFQITRFAFGRGNYQRMEIYGEKGALVYVLDETPDQDELYLCQGEVGRETRAFQRLPIPQRFRADQMQAFADRLLDKEDGLAADIRDGLANQRQLDAVILSAQEGRWVQP